MSTQRPAWLGPVHEEAKEEVSKARPPNEREAGSENLAPKAVKQGESPTRFYSSEDESSREGPFELVGKANRSSNSCNGELPAVLSLEAAEPWKGSNGCPKGQGGKL